MENTVSHEAFYCAHCGHIEPENPEDQNFVFVHLSSCRVMSDEMAHSMFNALANAMTHMALNECLLRRAEENITKAMIPFADKYLDGGSYCFNWLNADLTIKNKLSN